MRNLLISILFITLTACLPMEPKMGGGVIYNFCKNKIEWRNHNISDKEYETSNHRHFIDTNNTEYFIYVNEGISREERDNLNSAEYFIENGRKEKKNFYIDSPIDGRINFIACPENAKSTGDGNWIKVNY